MTVIPIHIHSQTVDNEPAPQLPGFEATPVGTTLADYGNAWIAERVTAKGQPLRPRTRELYEDELRLHIAPHLGDLDLSQITPVIVRTWNNKMRGTSGPGLSTAAKCYRLLRAMMNTASQDELIASNPCRIRGAGSEPTSERAIPTVLELYELAEAIDPRLRCLVLCAGFLGLRKGELLGLRRSDVDLAELEVHVVQARTQLRDGRQLIGPAKTEASHRTVTIPRLLLPELRTHLHEYAQSSDDGSVFTGAKGGPLGPTWLNTQWNGAREYVGLPDLHLHDLRHLAGTLAAITGATTKEVMERLGHTTMETALRYQHATRERERALADALDELGVANLPEPRRRYVEVKYG